jgi:hypothetical protein
MTRTPTLTKTTTPTKTPTVAPSATPVDASAPTITYSFNQTPNDAGWFTADVTITWTVEDTDTGIKSSRDCGERTVIVAGITRITCSAVNHGGVSASSTVTIKLDETAPTVKTNPMPGVFYVNEGGSQTVALTATDMSTVVSCTWQAGVLSGVCSSVVLPEGVWTLHVTATDGAGNVYDQDIGVYRVIEVDGPDALVTVAKGTPAVLTFTLADDSAITNATGTVCVGSACTAFTYDSGNSNYTVSIPTTALQAKTHSLMLKFRSPAAKSVVLGTLRVTAT